MIPHQTIEQILNTAQIIDVVQEFVSLRKRGVNFLGLCPFHNEKTPSFTVSPTKGIFKCFGCGKGGNAVNFIMEHESLSYPEALKYLAKKYSIEVVEKELSAEDIERENERESMLVISSYAARIFEENLFKSEEGAAIGLSYFKQRGFRQETLKAFNVGYCHDKWDGFTERALKDGYKLNYLVKTGLSIQKDDRTFDRFSGRVIFPIHSLSGQVLGFGGRTLRKDPKTAKYVNSPESDIYHKSRIVYGIYQARKTILKEDKCFIVEGYTDVLSLHEAGIGNVVASSGTALTVEQIRLIKRFTSSISILYDGDEAGIKASLRGIDLVLEEGMNVKVTPLPEGEDPDSFSKKSSNEEFLSFIMANETDFIRFKTALLLKEAKKDPIQKANLVKDIVRSIAVIPESITRTIYIQECSNMMGLSEQILYNEVNKLQRNKAFQDRNRYPSVSDLPKPIEQKAQPVKLRDGSLYSEREVIRLLLKYGSNEFDRIVNRDEGTEEVLSIAQFIVREITSDELDFTDPVYKIIFDDYAFHIKEGIFPGEKFFVMHQDPEISSLSADLLAESHELSKIWSSKKAYVETEDMILQELVPECVLKFKSDKIQVMIREVKGEIAVAQKSGESEKLDKLLRKQMMLSSMLTVIGKRLGNRIVL
ncbi:MAG TPA: DNA primase [Bacteroidales bacterium]|nr:DNA primase [Bacteroidales bacterium]